MEGIESAFAVGYFRRLLVFEFSFVREDFGAVVAHTAEGFEDYVEESLVVDWTCQVNVSKVSRVGVGMYVPHARVVDASVDWLAIDVGFVTSDSSGDFAGVDGNGLCYGILFLFLM